MTSTPPKMGEDLLGESWIELSSAATMAGVKSPDRITPLPFSSGEEYLRLLREAQRESNQSSRVVSLASSRRDTPRDSPNTELTPDEDLKNVYINYWNKEGNSHKDTDWLDEWNSRPDQQPPKDWKFEHPQKKKGAGYSIRLTRVGKNSLFSREILYSLILSNVLSLLLGAGLGLWLSRRGILLTRVVID
ncbi:BCL2/adenovirus E1B 19 kDa protein-interacting protein 3 isoform X2 [Anastrepha obliqua]|uniref:BCL2/adenovirus E1B 19 kDa protein-interacting protein 3 isoform X2 n=1 Tax=Anastrepha ludens TaxID=28586 RepID=UPI0023AF83E8|nr:BCL2/adenovirus E1B 19 kDa protein-interacting protein 3 isoform X2 [Anastrepha ludens]XP_054732553.1 BCL2/adenovirus E1B 19 kDa protein-interacting protein 3 isoform X2 [Anastrepha obliqua]